MEFSYSIFHAAFYGFGTISFIILILAAGCFIMIFAKNINTWQKNNNAPCLTVTAKLIRKRTSVSHHSHANAGDISGAHGFHTTYSSTYFVTFQTESGEQLQFSVTGLEYGKLAEGDIGKLSFQGTRLLSFEKMATGT